MFDNFKKLAELKKIQENMKNEEATAESRGVFATVNGNFDVKKIKLNPELSQEEQEEAIVDAINKANRAIKEAMAKNLMNSGLGL